MSLGEVALVEHNSFYSVFLEIDFRCYHCYLNGHRMLMMPIILDLFYK